MSAVLITLGVFSIAGGLVNLVDSAYFAAYGQLIIGLASVFIGVRMGEGE